MAATDDGDDTIEIILCHWCTRRQAETVVEQILGHFTPHHSCSVFALTLSHVSGVSRLSLSSSIEWPESSIKNLSRSPHFQPPQEQHFVHFRSSPRLGDKCEMLASRRVR